MIIRDDLADAGEGSPNPWWGDGNTPLQPVIEATESWTIEAIINFQTAPDVESVIANNGPGSEWWWRATNGDTLQCLFADVDTTTGDVDHIVPGGFDDNWHHIALVFDRTAEEIRTYYGDVSGGTLIGTTSFSNLDYDTIGNATRDMEIGQFDLSFERDFNGFMDRVMISNEVLAPGSFRATVGGKILFGDVNCDGSVDLLDVAPFVDLIVSGGFSSKADVNMDGSVDLLDVGPFVDLLVGS